MSSRHAAAHASRAAWILQETRPMERLPELVYLMLPAYFANMAPPFVKYWRGWNRPIHHAWLGDHKTVMGFVFGVLSGVLTAYTQARVDAGVARLWPPSMWLAIGLAQGVGAMAGDMVKSFVKRRIGIAPGKPWVPADQLDFAVGALIPIAFLVPLSAADVLWILAITFVADIAVNHVSFYAGIRSTKW
jgi:CDP-2,3-bis-(O-geranylgeranyl)-sn-glycerol synthase